MLKTDRILTISGECMRKMTLKLDAFKNNDEDLIKAMLDEKGIDLNAHNCNTGMTLLHVAIQYHHINAAYRLIGIGADVCAKNHDGRTPLQFAVMNNSHVDIVKELIPNGSRYLEINFYGLDSLDFAISGRSNSQDVKNRVDHALVKMLLDSGAEVNTRDHNACSPLQCAIYTGDVELVKILLNAGANINNQNRIGATALHDAVLCCNKEMVHLLLNHGAHVDAYIVINDSLEVFEEVFDIRRPAWLEQTALHWAAMLNIDNSHKNIIELLLAFGSDVNQPETTKVNGVMTAFSYILMYGDVDLVNLCTNHYNVDLKQLVYGNSAVLFAAQNENKDVMDLVLRSGNEIDFEGVFGIRPLHYASLVSMLENVRKLIYRGADVNSKDIFGWTPLYLCLKALQLLYYAERMNDVNRRSMDRPNFAEERRQTMRLLLESGSDLNSKKYRQQTTLFEEAIILDVDDRNIILEHMAKVVAKTNKEILDDRNMKVFMKNPKAQDYYRKCQAELTTMRTSQIVGTSITYWSVLTEPLDVVARYARNEEFVKEFETINYYQNAFPTYTAWLRDKFDAAIPRLEVIQRVCTVLSTTLQFADPNHVAFEIIFKYLNEADTDLIMNYNKDSKM